MDRFDTMLAFTRVVELASFTKAALSLNLPKTTISAQVLALEKRLAVKLLHRTTRHVSVTTDGAAYYERAVRLLNELDETEASVRQFTTKPKGRLRIDVPASLGRRIIIPAIKTFFHLYPEIDLEIGCSDRPVDLLQEGVDLVIRGGDLLDQSMVARRIGSIRMVTCATPAYLQAAGAPSVPAEIERHVTVNYMSSKSGRIFEFDFVKDGVTTMVTGHRNIAINDGEACMEAGLSGVGVMQIPTFMVQDKIANGELQVVLGEYLSEDIPVFVMYPQNRHLSSKVRAFVDWVAELFANSDLLQARTSLR